MPDTAEQKAKALIEAHILGPEHTVINMESFYKALVQVIKEGGK